MTKGLAANIVVPAICGGLITLGFAPFGWWPLTLLGVVGLIALWWDAPVRPAAVRGFVFGLASFGTGLYWPYVSVHEFGHASAPVAVAVTALLVVYLALYPALVGAFAGATRRWPRLLWALVLVPGAWLLSELARGRIGTGFPWLSLGYSLVDSPVSALAPIVGVYGMSLALVVAAGVLCLLVAGSLVGRVIAVAVIAITPILIWLVPVPSHWTEPAGEALSASVVQGSFGEKIKSKSSTLGPTLERYKQLTKASDADLVVWPETAVPVPANRVQSYLSDIDAMAKRKDQALLAGTLVARESRYYNALLGLGAASGRYYKRHLVPFGEYFPVPSFVKRWIGEIVPMRFGGLAFGPAQQAPIEAHGVDIGLSICFEDVFPREIARSLPQAGVLVNVTNDAWFAGTIGPAQHLQIARVRALESGRPMLRAANTGISAIIGYAGRARQTTPQFQVATLDSPNVQPRKGATPYVALGNEPAWWTGGTVVLIGLIGAALARRRRL
ncbi:apolipoprotein N-acyltransferase [Salinisphaera sp. USBA-960]|uniref:apolipoprotein N-acyltransferase n=1 Tax=Salinisphaera orenii TaxID=856731 RepID=UPI0013A6032A|nr:apolipoprotein N-acyltransferase [Salifodinibacter halophilus]NNC27177.1 apolipoprotein N-acyltransferase [Salifodinibacter halophilus]